MSNKLSTTIAVTLSEVKSELADTADAESPDVIVKKALTHIKCISFMNIDPDDDKCVDLLVSRRLAKCKITKINP